MFPVDKVTGGVCRAENIVQPENPSLIQTVPHLNSWRSAVSSEEKADFISCVINS